MVFLTNIGVKFEKQPFLGGQIIRYTLKFVAGK